MNTKRKVAYLIGAGGTHGCVKAIGSESGILMSHLTKEIVRRVRKLVEPGSEYHSLSRVVNEVVEDASDFEHLITFFDESPSSLHRKFAGALRKVFEGVLKDKLQEIESQFGKDRVSLYAALLDMYNVEDIDESLHGIMTLNYDDYIEVAAREIYGTAQIDLPFVDCPDSRPRSPLLKLHGSLGWEDAWPMRRRDFDSTTMPLWIPPGIRKGKERYPFNLIWGWARDLLDCDVVRVIGCRLGPSDWDLISLLFGTRHANNSRELPYSIEIIDSPLHARRLQKSYPYLDVKSLFEIDTLSIGNQLVAEYVGGSPRGYDTLSTREKDRLSEVVEQRQTDNWFRVWLVQMGERLQATLGEEATDTNSGSFRHWLGI